MFQRFIFLITLLLLSSPLSLFAETIISGASLSTNTTWTKAASPYIITDDVYINNGVTLALEPGTIVKFKNKSAFYINGELSAQGNTGDEIYFTSYKDDSISGDSNGDGTTTIPAMRDWDQLYVLATGHLNFAHVIARYAGFYSGGAAIHAAGGESLITDSQLTNNPLGIYQESGSTTISASILTNNNVGFGFIDGTANITQSQIHHNTEAGLRDYYGRAMDARHNWWGDNSGPYHVDLNPNGLGDKIVGANVLFDPWIGQTPAVIPPTVSDENSFTTSPFGFSSVVFIPGVEASFLYRQEPGCTLFNCENELWVPNRNDDARKLFMTTAGESVDPSIYTREVIDNAFLGFMPIYDGFIKSMNKMVAAGDIADFEPLPYDWRFDLDKVVARGATTTKGISYTSDLSAGQLPYMIAEIQKLANRSKNGKVTIVAHSNGGLVAKALMQKLQEMKTSNQSDLVDKIDKVILVAVPQLGTPEAIPTMLHGADQALGYGFLLNQSVARQAVENMPSAYNLLPSTKYFATVQEPVIKFDQSAVKIMPGLASYGTEISSADKLQQFALGQLDGRAKPAVTNLATPNILNSQMFTKSQITHDNLDNWQFPTTTEVIQIAGWGIPTLKTTEYLAKDNKLDIHPLLTTDGDGTVVSPSATGAVGSHRDFYLDIQKYNEVNNKSWVHKDIFEMSSVQQEITNLIKNTIDLPNYFSLAKPTPTAGQKNLLISVHSPVSLNAYDNLGNHTGLIPNPNPNSDLQLIEEDIPNSKYLDFGEGKYIVLPFGNGLAPANYAIKLAGLSFGIFSYEQEETTDGVSTTTVSFTDIPVTPMTIASLNVSAGTSTTLLIDADGDGKNDFAVKPNTGFDLILYLQMMKKVVASFDLKPLVEKLLEARIDNMIKLIERGKIKNVERRIKLTVWLADRPHWRNRQIIPQSDKDILVKMLNQLLDNLK
ncbi:MAG: alpha/beta hydrolase [Candidatus Paceibacterota bacterium]|jgi:pimeloyl-ACP methyl ester carboxylesterase